MELEDLKQELLDEFPVEYYAIRERINKVFDKHFLIKEIKE